MQFLYRCCCCCLFQMRVPIVTRSMFRSRLNVLWSIELEGWSNNKKIWPTLGNCTKCTPPWEFDFEFLAKELQKKWNQFDIGRWEIDCFGGNNQFGQIVQKVERREKGIKLLFRFHEFKFDCAVEKSCGEREGESDWVRRLVALWHGSFFAGAFEMQFGLCALAWMMLWLLSVFFFRKFSLNFACCRMAFPPNICWNVLARKSRISYWCVSEKCVAHECD